MRLLILITTVVSIVIFSLLFFFRPAGSLPQMTLSSDPYPLTLGTTRLLLSLKETSGVPINNAVLDVTVTMKHDAMLPLSRRVSAGQDGTYAIPMEWPMAGQWLVEISASLPDGRQLSDQYEVFVYSTPPSGNIRQTTYRSLNESSNASANLRELRFVIPQGTQAMILSGHGEDVVPKEIRLSVSNQNVLVIQNDDIVDHSVGPFFIRSGEVIRQEFTSPASYIGACSVRFGDQVSIVVED
jgi:hypothetical protein